MLQLLNDPDDPYVPFVERRARPWWAYELKPRRAGPRLARRSRRLIGHALIRLGRAVAAENQTATVG